MIVELSEELEAALKLRADAQGVSPEGFVHEVLENLLVPAPANRTPKETGYGMLAKYGPAPSAEEIDENRAEMFRGFGERF